MPRTVTVTIASQGLNRGPRLRPHMFVDLRQLARSYGYVHAPGGGVTTSGLNPAVRGSISCVRELGRLMFQVGDTVEHLRMRGQKDIFIATACKWGKHRSVAMAEELAEHFESMGYSVACYHLDRHYFDRHAPTVPNLFETWNVQVPFQFIATGTQC